MGTEISKLLNISDSFFCIFDVTSLLESYLADLYCIVRSKKVNTIFSFELLKEKRVFDDSELIHNLHRTILYEYSCLAESLHTKEKVVIHEDKIINKREFDQLAQTCIELEKNRDELKKNRDCLENFIATNITRLILAIYFLAGLPVFFWLYRSIRKPGGWDEIEPLAFLLTFGWVILNYLLQALFAGKFLSLDPREIYPVLKRWLKKQLEKSRINKTY